MTVAAVIAVGLGGFGTDCQRQVGRHSHDATDQLDDVLEADAAGRRALLFSLAGLGLTAAIQAVVVVLSGPRPPPTPAALLGRSGGPHRGLPLCRFDGLTA